MRDFLSKREQFEEQALPQLENLHRTALYVLDNESEAQECVSRTFARAYLSWSEHAYSRSCRTWLFKVMAEVLVTKYQPAPNPSSARNDNYTFEEYPMLSQLLNEHQADSSEPVNYSTTSFDDFRNAIRNIPDEFKLVVVLSLVEDFSYLEIASIAGINLETVKFRLHHGRKFMLRELLVPVAEPGDYSSATGRVGSRRTG